MRTAFFLLALCSSASAQTERPAAIGDPDVLFVILGKDWDVLEAEVPAPDSGAVLDGAGTVWWPVADDDVAWVQADVRGGRVVRVSVRPADGVPTEVLADFAREIKRQAGQSGPDGFHNAAEWSDYQRALRGRVPDVKVQVAVFVADRLLVLRLTPGSY